VVLTAGATNDAGEPKEGIVGFIQVMEVTTSSYDEMERLHEQWLRDTEGKRTVVSEKICRDRDRPDTYVLIVEFESYDAAMTNNELPETARIAEGIAGLASEPTVFRNLDLIRAD
jgi:quinol monooxygenase YgiN